MNATARLRGVLRIATVASALLLAAACTDLFSPHGTAKPQLRSIGITYLSVTTGIMHIVAYPADTSFRLGAGESVPILITVSSGDQEFSALYPQYCPVPMRGWGYVCFEFEFGAQPGVTWESLNGYVAGIGGRIQTWLSSGPVGYVVLFDFDDQVRRARRALSWPGVTWVELGSTGYCIEGASCIIWSRLTRPVNVEIGPPHPENGVLDVQHGDTVTVLYTQPGGQVATSHTVVP